MANQSAPLRGALGRAVASVVPGFEEALYHRRRDAEVRRQLADPRYAALRTRAGGAREPHIVIVPQLGPNVDTWRAGGGNFLFEVHQAAIEHLPGRRTTIFAVEPAEDSVDWHCRLITYLQESGATHVIAQVEGDPNASPGTNTWDVLWSVLAPRWDGILLGLVTDSYFRWVTANLRRLARISDRFLLVDICMPMDGVLVRGRPEVGPVNMPVSNASLAVIDEATAALPRAHDVTFIGALYPYRVAMLDAIRATGATVAVNPHRDDEAADYEGSRRRQPSYLDYMGAMAQSRITLNFSQANAGTVQQLKTRILEATAMGCLLLTDDVDRTSRFWIPEEEYGWFASLEDLPRVVEHWLADPERLERVRLAGQRRAREINVSSFWGGIQLGLERRGLRPL